MLKTCFCNVECIVINPSVAILLFFTKAEDVGNLGFPARDCQAKIPRSLVVWQLQAI